MDNQALRTLQLLEEIEQNHAPSQRYLAEKLNVSLGLVNSFIKRLAQKGYFKITTIPKNRVKYILTPKGAAEKTQLTYDYIRYSYQLYKGARKKLRIILNELVRQGVRRVVFYGVSNFSEIAYISLHETPLKIVAVVDHIKLDEKFMGMPVNSPSKLGELSFDKILLTAEDSTEEIRERIAAEGISDDKVVTFQTQAATHLRELADPLPDENNWRALNI